MNGEGRDDSVVIGGAAIFPLIVFLSIIGLMTTMWAMVLVAPMCFSYGFIMVSAIYRVRNRK